MQDIRNIVQPPSPIDPVQLACMDRFLHAVYKFCPDAPDLHWCDMLNDFLSAPWNSWVSNYSALPKRATVDAVTFRAALEYFHLFRTSDKVAFLRRRRPAPLVLSHRFNSEQKRYLELHAMVPLEPRSNILWNRSLELL
ncbi:hypothetical protein HYH03_015384 [Edaphochlamys debaryana]|uniref:Uncharacterized protein n=1 Tax=Edaphochlamys debaryana TaxID=47281 RepID=A0A835XM23_9CHLO|nr:hypothetical protein HYH03_015384 [Edaphochlamys debaryana]|eukprot:KAG2485940.1 hypothetical protein HYH03_015384 [Edaphochlamys debaryana]